MEKNWKTNITFLMKVFRESLLSLTPHLDAVRIPWREGEAYDQWDAIAGVLYDQLVLDSIRWGLSDRYKGLNFPAYDMRLPDYTELDLIEVCHPNSHAERCIFWRLVTIEQPLDSVECLPEKSDGELSKSDSRICRFDRASFQAWVRKNQNLEGPIENLTIEV